MEFLENIQIYGWCAERQIGVAGDVPDRVPTDPPSMRAVFGQRADPKGQEAAVASACIDALGSWDECLLWVRQWGVFPSSEDWPQYYAARARRNERRSLEVAPGHLFYTGETGGFAEFLQLVLQNAWDAEALAVKSGKLSARVFVSHDEWVQVWSNARAAHLVNAFKTGG